VKRKSIHLAAAIALMVASTSALAQTMKPDPAPAKATAGPTVAASTVGVKAPVASSATSRTAAARNGSLGAGRNIALMVVGGAAIIIGAVIGGTAGLIIAITGAALGLYGLYYFIQ
jgi:hypothetical protein